MEAPVCALMQEIETVDDGGIRLGDGELVECLVCRTSLY